MRYAIFSALYTPSIGGVENFTEHIAKELVGLGHAITIVTSNVADLPPIEESGSLTVVRLPCRNLLHGRLPIPENNAEAHRLWDKLNHMPCDGVLVNTRFYPHSLKGVQYAKRKGLSPIVLDHGSAYLTLGNPALDTAIKLYEHGITALIKHTHPHFCGVSQKSCEWLRTFGITTHDVVPNAIDAEAFRNGASQRDFRREYDVDSRNLLVASVGRLVPEKGVTQLVEAGRLLFEQHVPGTILLAGDGPLRDALVARAAPNTYLVGPLDKPDVAALLLQADVMCLPSRSEGFGAVLLEAAACSTPSVATKVGVAPDLMENDGLGMLIPDVSPSTIANALSIYANNREIAHKHGQNAQAYVEKNYTWNAAALQAEKLLIACAK